MPQIFIKNRGKARKAKIRYYIIPDFPLYKINKRGDIRRVKDNKRINLIIKKGYYCLRLSHKGERK